jgi:photosystem II stability/assembly factor-like uncharacterized protein
MLPIYSLRFRIRSFRHIFIALTFFIFSFYLGPAAFAQPWLEGIEIEKRENFLEVQKSFEAYFQRKSQKKGDGYKQFKRWEWYWQSRLNADGSFPQTNYNWEEWKNYQKKIERRANKTSGNLPSWEPLGPEAASNGNMGLLDIGRVNCIAFHPTAPETLWVGSPSGGLWRSSDGGKNWQVLGDTLPVMGITDIIVNPNNPQNLYIATGDWGGHSQSVGVLVSYDGGVTFAPTGLIYAIDQRVQVLCLHFHPDSSNVILAGTSRGLLRTSDAGVTWKTIVPSVFVHDIKFHPVKTQKTYFSTNNGLIYVSADGGQSFARSTTGLPSAELRRIELAVTPAAPDNVYAVCADKRNAAFGGLYVSSDEGRTWQLRSNKPNIMDGSPDGSDPENGHAWWNLSIAVSPQNPDIIHVGGINIFRSNDQGRVWQLAGHWTGRNGPYIHADNHDLEYKPGSTELYVGNDGGVYKKRDDETQWQVLNSGLAIMQFYRMGNSERNPQLIVAGAQDNGSSIFSNTRWQKATGGDGMDCFIDYANPETLFTSLQNGTLFRSVNNGQTFTEITPPNQKGQGAWVTPWAQDRQNPEILYAAYQGFFISMNKGNTWQQLNTSLYGDLPAKQMAIAPTNSQIIYVSLDRAVTGGTEVELLRSQDGGRRWKSIFRSLPSLPITSLFVSPTDPNRLWLTMGGYSRGQKVFETKDAGGSWVNISGSLPNLPANTVTMDVNNGVLYLGMDIGVYYFDTTAQDWALFDLDLPRVTISELEINYATRKLRAATFGRGVWQTDLLRNTACKERFILTAEQGIVEDGSGNLNYGNFSDCSWLIRPEKEGVIEFTFLNIDIHPEGDAVRIYDGEDSGAKLLGIFSGSQIPPPITASGNRMLVIFESDSAQTAKGFKAQYRLKDGVGLQESELSPSTLIYPNPNAGKLIIQSPNPQAFQLKLRDITGKLHFRIELVWGMQWEIDLPSFLEEGMYVIELISENKKLISKLQLLRK